MPNERCRLSTKKYSERGGQMFAVLEQLEHITRGFLKTANAALDDQFKKHFARESKKW